MNEEAYKKALEELRACSSKHGFLASSTHKSNYGRVWARDSMICSIAALMSGEKDLIKTAKKSLQTLMKYQHHQGEIPSNVDPLKKNVSFGGTAGRVDAHLWFLIGFGQYVKRTKDKSMLRRYDKHFKKALKLTRLYEFNHKSLIYVPMSGDWADEYPQEGYTLYDQLLYLQAFKEDCYLRKKLRRRRDKDEEKIVRITQRITTNYRVCASKKGRKTIYDASAYQEALSAGLERKAYWLSHFNPAGYGKFFDAFANSLALVMELGTKQQQEKTHAYIARNFSTKTQHLLPAFWPVITKKDPLWPRLAHNHKYAFKNKPYHYHNGGLWPVITGFYAASLAQTDREQALRYLKGINEANKKNNWGFYEYHDGKEHKANGTAHQAWSAAAAIIAHQALHKEEEVFQ